MCSVELLVLRLCWAKRQIPETYGVTNRTYPVVMWSRRYWLGRHTDNMDTNLIRRRRQKFICETMQPNILRRLRGLFKYLPGEDYLSIKRKRGLEIISITLTALFVIIFVHYYMLEKKTLLRCSSQAETYMVNITGSIFLANFNLRARDGMDYPPTARWISDDGTIWGCPCLLKPCINKCCNDGETFDELGNGVCEKERQTFNQTDLKVHSAKDTADAIEEIEVGSDHFYVIKGNHSCRNSEKFYLAEDAQYAYLMRDGRVFRSHPRKHFRKYREFCVEPDSHSAHNQYVMCTLQSGNGLKRLTRWHGAGMLISVPCLLIVLITYCLVPQLFNLHGKELVCQVTSLTIAYTFLGFMKITSYKLSNMLCIIIGHIIQVSVLSSFFWLNILCYDIWWAFSGLSPEAGSQARAEKVKFLLYSGYAWGGPLIILALTLVMEYGPGRSFHSSPVTGEDYRCFFNDEDARILYLYLPLGVLVFINTSLFIITAFRLKSHADSVNMAEKPSDADTKQSNVDKNKADTKRFVLFLKLSLVMGLNWILEVLSVFVSPQSVFWVVADVANALVGLAMLYLFVCKRRILRVLNQRLCPQVDIVPAEHSNAITSARSDTHRCYSVKFRANSDAGGELTNNTADRRMTVTIIRTGST